MLKNKLRAILPIAALVLVGACSDTTGPQVPDLAQAQQEEAEDSRKDGAAGRDTQKVADENR